VEHAAGHLKEFFMDVNIDEKLGLVEYKADHSHSHIKIKNPDICVKDCKDKPCTKVCPAHVYHWEESQKRIIVAYENCVECGAARVMCPYSNIDFHWPRGGFGVQYKLG
jgi:ferredoxin like protein